MKRKRYLAREFYERAFQPQKLGSWGALAREMQERGYDPEGRAEILEELDKQGVSLERDAKQRINWTEEASDKSLPGLAACDDALLTMHAAAADSEGVGYEEFICANARAALHIMQVIDPRKITDTKNDVHTAFEIASNAVCFTDGKYFVKKGNALLVCWLYQLLDVVVERRGDQKSIRLELPESFSPFLFDDHFVYDPENDHPDDELFADESDSVKRCREV